MEKIADSNKNTVLAVERAAVGRTGTEHGREPGEDAERLEWRIKYRIKYLDDACAVEVACVRVACMASQRLFHLPTGDAITTALIKFASGDVGDCDSQANAVDAAALEPGIGVLHEFAGQATGAA